MEVTMRATAVRVLGVVLAALFLAGGTAWAQDKPAPDSQQPAVAAESVVGNWEGAVETPNGTIGFTLQIKLDGQKVSGQISSAEGGGPISGTWTDGKLTLSFDYNGSAMEMTGALKDGALTGEMVYQGETVMPWTAKRPS
jgi:hypothetical protein